MPKGENSKKVAGNAKKAASAAAKQAKVDAEVDKKEDVKWQKGSKDSSKKESAAEKKAEEAAKKAARQAELEAEEASIKTIKTNPKAGAKKAPTKSSGLDAALASMDGPSGGSSSKSAALAGSGIDDALAVLSLAGPSDVKTERHPERRLKAAYAAFEERRMQEGKESGEFSGLRQQQVKERLRKEFERSEENPFNKSNVVSFDATKSEVHAQKNVERDALENRLAQK